MEGEEGGNLCFYLLENVPMVPAVATVHDYRDLFLLIFF